MFFWDAGVCVPLGDTRQGLSVRLRTWRLADICQPLPASNASAWRSKRLPMAPGLANALVCQVRLALAAPRRSGPTALLSAKPHLQAKRA
jgi:hypothetical protein